MAGTDKHTRNETNNTDRPTPRERGRAFSVGMAQGVILGAAIVWATPRLVEIVRLLFIR